LVAAYPEDDGRQHVLGRAGEHDRILGNGGGASADASIAEDDGKEAIAEIDGKEGVKRQADQGE
jgi:hypothetical protein